MYLGAYNLPGSKRVSSGSQGPAEGTLCHDLLPLGPKREAGLHPEGQGGCVPDPSTEDTLGGLSPCVCPGPAAVSLSRWVLGPEVFSVLTAGWAVGLDGGQGRWGGGWVGGQG